MYDSYLVHVDGMEAHLCRGKLWLERVAPDARVTVRHTEEVKWVSDLFLSLNTHEPSRSTSAAQMGESYLSMMVRSLRYMVLSGWMEEWARWVCVTCEVDKEARTLAAAEAAVAGGMKRWSRPCSPEAVRMGWARTLANRLSGCKQNHDELIILVGSLLD